MDKILLYEKEVNLRFLSRLLDLAELYKNKNNEKLEKYFRDEFRYFAEID